MSSKQQTTTGIPSYIEQPTQSALTNIQSWLNSSSNRVYGSKPGETLFTPLTANQNKAIGNVSWLANQDLSKMLGIDKAGSMLNEFAAFKPGKLTDETGYLGSIDSYVNPYLKQVLDPQIREIEDGLQRRRRDLGANAQMSGAFGDARHGVLEAGMYDDAAENIADVTGRTYAQSYDNAMGLRAADRDAAMAANANKATAASGIAGLGQQYLNSFTNVNDALFNAGQIQREALQEQADVRRTYTEAVKNKRYDDALKLLGAIRGSTYPTTTTQTQKSNDGLSGIFGSLLGGLFGAL